MIEDHETEHFMLTVGEALSVKSDRIAVPFDEAPGMLTWVQYQVALNNARDPSDLPAGARRTFEIAEQLRKQNMFDEIIKLVLPYVSEAVPAGAERFLQNS